MKNQKYTSGDIYQFVVIGSIVLLLLITTIKTGEVNEFLAGALVGAVLPMKGQSSESKE